MANANHLALLRQGVLAWNTWRKAHPTIRPDLHRVDLHQANLRGADFHETDLSEAELFLADLDGTDLREAKLRRRPGIGESSG